VQPHRQAPGSIDAGLLDPADQSHARLAAEPADRQLDSLAATRKLERAEPDPFEVSVDFLDATDDLDVPRHGRVEGERCGAPAPVEWQAAVLDDDAPGSDADLRRRPLEGGAVEGAAAFARAESEGGQPRPDVQPRLGQTADGRAVL
jgi:hypothetical protein